MKRKIFILFIFVNLLAASCGLETSGIWTPSVWIDAPTSGALVLLDSPVAIQAHTDEEPARMVLNINGVPLVELTIFEVSPGRLWEGYANWTPVSTGRYALSITATLLGSDRRSGEVVVTV